MSIKLGTRAEYQAWLTSQPEPLRNLAAEFEIGGTHLVQGSVLYVVGHREDDVLIMSPHDPATDAELALFVSTRVHISAQTLRMARS